MPKKGIQGNGADPMAALQESVWSKNLSNSVNLAFFSSGTYFQLSSKRCTAQFDKPEIICIALL